MSGCPSCRIPSLISVAIPDWKSGLPVVSYPSLSVPSLSVYGGISAIRQCQPSYRCREPVPSLSENSAAEGSLYSRMLVISDTLAPGMALTRLAGCAPICRRKPDVIGYIGIAPGCSRLPPSVSVSVPSSAYTANRGHRCGIRRIRRSTASWRQITIVAIFVRKRVNAVVIRWRRWL